jgi:hypothetical protein
LQRNTIKSFIDVAVQKMALKDWGTDILAYKIHKDICASTNYFHKTLGMINVFPE